MRNMANIRKNCWEFKKCGREPGGVNASKLGICPVGADFPNDGINSGKNCGRICWAVAGTFCDGKIQGEFAEKQITCMECDFFQKVLKEEKENFHLLLPGQAYKIAED